MKVGVGLVVAVILLASSVVAQTVINGVELPVVDGSRLLCNEQSSADGRILCSLNASRYDVLTFWPESCIRLSQQESRDCLAVAAASMPCRVYPSFEERDVCFRTKLNIRPAQEAFTICIHTDGADRLKCLEALNEDIVRMASFRFDGLEDKATDAYKRGVSPSRVVGIISRLENAKLLLVQAKLRDERARRPGVIRAPA
ncbi:MAG: hypothetical protein AABY13_01420, partial [Nanoarchaeota archaeon]